MAKKPINIDTAPETPAEEITSNHAPGTQLASTVDLSQFGSVIGDAVARGISQAAPPRKMTIGEYVRRGGINQYHPGTPAETPKLTREYYQNGHPIDWNITYDREVELLNRITHSGRYIDRLVEVVVVQNGSEEAVDIRFSNKRDKAFELKGKARDFTDMLQQIVAAQDAEREEMEDEKADRAERKAARQAKATGKAGSFGRGKATREARERAGV